VALNAGNGVKERAGAVLLAETARLDVGERGFEPRPSLTLDQPITVRILSPSSPNGEPARFIAPSGE
jgi:hypothetical protein